MTDANPSAIRNILYVEDMHVVDNSGDPSHVALSSKDIESIAESHYTHILVSFLHFNSSRVLCYNDIHADQYDWEQFRNMQSGEHAKKVLASYGGWVDDMPDWVRIAGKEEEAAEAIASFLQEQQLDGIDFNLEGPERHDKKHLNVLGKLAVNLRHLVGDEKLVTIAPMRDNLVEQLGAIDDACELKEYKSWGYQSWRDVLSWINCQFYTYNGSASPPTPNTETADQVVSGYNGFLKEHSITPDRLVAGFPLWDESVSTGSDLNNNATQLARAQAVVAELGSDPKISEQGGFGGVFLWRYKFSRHPANFDWGAKVIPVPIYQYRADGIEALRYQYSLIPGVGGLGWTNDGAAFWAFDKGIVDVEGAVGIYGYYSVYDSGCWRYEYYLHEEEAADWTQVGDEPLFCVFESQVPGTQPVYSYHAPPTHDYKLKRYQYSLNPNLTIEGWTKDPEPAFYASTVKSGLDEGAGQLA